MTHDDLVAGVLAGERRPLGRAISLVERLGSEGRRLAADLHPSTGRAWRVGITGAPGVGRARSSVRWCGCCAPGASGSRW